MIGTLMNEVEKTSFDAAAKAEMTTVSKLSRSILTAWLKQNGYMLREAVKLATDDR